MLSLSLSGCVICICMITSWAVRLKRALRMHSVSMRVCTHLKRLFVCSVNARCLYLMTAQFQVRRTARWTTARIQYNDRDVTEKQLKKYISTGIWYRRMMTRMRKLCLSQSTRCVGVCVFVYYYVVLCG